MKQWYEKLFENYAGNCDNVKVFTDDDGIEHRLECNERYYVPSEISWLLKSSGFKKIEIFGVKLGAFSREDKLTVGDYEMLIVAEKQQKEDL